MWYVYLIASTGEDWSYVGFSNRLNERIQEHNAGKVQSTKAYAPYLNPLPHRKEYADEKAVKKRAIMLGNPPREAAFYFLYCRLTLYYTLLPVVALSCVRDINQLIQL